MDRRKNVGCSPHFAGFHLTMWHLPHQHLEEPERGGCPLGQKLVLSRNRRIFESKIARRRYLSLMCSQSFFEQNVSCVQWKLLRFFYFEIKPEMRDVLDKMRGNAGIKPKCGISRTIAGRFSPMAMHTPPLISSSGLLMLSLLSGLSRTKPHLVRLA